MQNYDFIALDVETANEEYWSICQIGLAYFKDGQLVDTWKSFVDPETEFSYMNISIHGILPEMVQGAIKLPELFHTVSKTVPGAIVAHHMPFDRLAFQRCANHVGENLFDCHWLDTARVARRTWNEVRQKGYSLSNLTKILNIGHDCPHDALDDAIAAGRVLLKAEQVSGVSVQEWLVKSKIKKNSVELREIANAEPDTDGVLYGEVIVFTGALSMTRVEAARLAYQAGCNVDVGVNRNTTLLVVGGQEISKLAGHDKSSKHRKAEELIRQGQPIRIIGEADFRQLICG